MHDALGSLNVVDVMDAQIPSHRDEHVGQLRSWRVAAVWMIPAILSTVETVMFARQSGRPIAVWRAFVGEAPQWFGWAALTPVIIGLGTRCPLRHPFRARAIFVHFAASLGASLLLAMGDALVNAWVRPSPVSLMASARNWFLGSLPATTLVYFAIVIASYAWHDAARLRERERQAAALEAELREAQLGALRMQLQPHFLFNSLNAVMALVRDRETEQAVRALSLLSDVLRAAVNAGGAHETSLASELDFASRYLSIEQVRFGDRLRVRFETPEELGDALVPVFILQPFVENALKHGVLRNRGANEIAVSAAAEGPMLVLRVSDDGRGLAATSAPNPGIGISNARRRLERMYGAAGELSVANAAVGTGVEVTIRLPLRREASRPAASRAAAVEAIG